MFKYRKLISNPIPKVQLNSPCKGIEYLCNILEREYGCKVWIVGGGIRQLVREVWWGKSLEVLNSPNLFNWIVDNSRDFDVLLDTTPLFSRDSKEFKEVKQKVLDILTCLVGSKVTKEVDIIFLPNYLASIDLASNYVKHDGKCLSFLALEPGEDYINADNPYLNGSSKGRMELRWLINHSWHRPGNKDWFKAEGQEVPKELREHFYYSTYQSKIEQLKEMYGGK